MDKLNQFKDFIKTHRHVYKLIESKKYTWQQLYEHYDIFGEDDELFKEIELNNKSTETKENEGTKSKQSSNIINTLAGMDVNKISDGLNGMKKILNILSEVAKPEEQPVLTRRKISKPYQSSDD